MYTEVQMNVVFFVNTRQCFSSYRTHIDLPEKHAKVVSRLSDTEGLARVRVTHKCAVKSTLLLQEIYKSTADQV